MIRAIRLVVFPFKTWERITASRQGPVSILLLYLLPLLLVGVSLEAYALVRWGEQRGEFEYRSKIPEPVAVRYAVTQGVLLLASIGLATVALSRVAASFQLQSSLSQCFMLAAYGFTPILLARYLDAIPALNTWICWTLGALGALSVLYHGVALALRPEQTKGFGLYLFSVILVLLFTGLSHFVARSVLSGKIPL